MANLTETPHGFILRKGKQSIPVDWGFDQFGEEGFVRRLVKLLNTGKLEPDKYYPDGMVFSESELENIRQGVREGDENAQLRYYLKYTLDKINDQNLVKQLLHYIPMKYIEQ